MKQLSWIALLLIIGLSIENAYSGTCTNSKFKFQNIRKKDIFQNFWSVPIYKAYGIPYRSLNKIFDSSRVFCKVGAKMLRGKRFETTKMEIYLLSWCFISRNFKFLNLFIFKIKKCHHNEEFNICHDSNLSYQFLSLQFKN